MSENKRGLFRISQMTVPANEWIWSLFDEADKHTSLSKSGFKSAEDAAHDICQLLGIVGADTEKVDIWIERKVRTRWKCK